MYLFNKLQYWMLSEVVCNLKYIFMLNNFIENCLLIHLASIYLASVCQNKIWNICTTWLYYSLGSFKKWPIKITRLVNMHLCVRECMYVRAHSKYVLTLSALIVLNEFWSLWECVYRSERDKSAIFIQLK